MWTIHKFSFAPENVKAGYLLEMPLWKLCTILE